jgi:hypothetical protein
MLFDPTNLPKQPEAELESNLALAQYYTIGTGESQNIAPGDWVELLPGVLGSDPNYGRRYQVCNLYDGEIGILVSDNNDGINYSETHLSTVYIYTVFRHVPGE